MTQQIDIIVLGAGSGKRMNASCNKMFLNIDGTPLLYRTLKLISLSPAIGRIFPVISLEDMDKFQQMIDANAQIEKIEGVIEGGKERSDSVKKALHYIYTNKKSEIILIHDGARPFISSDLIKKIRDSVLKTGACLPVMPVCETVRQKVNGKQVIINRDALTTAQTPQAFKFDYIDECFLSKAGDKLDLTDDIAYIEHFGHPVEMVEGEKWNIKITKPEDVLWAECLLNTYKNLQI